MGETHSNIHLHFHEYLHIFAKHGGDGKLVGIDVGRKKSIKPACAKQALSGCLMIRASSMKTPNRIYRCGAVVCLGLDQGCLWER